jgi:uncharacterized protein YjeT (DUF2065 family)
MEAELAKLSLDEHGIFCTLAGENAHLYGGAPFAMPISLLVEDEKFDEANRVLHDDSFGLATEPEPAPSTVNEAATQASNNPWEILALAGLLFLPAIMLVLQRQATVWVVRRRTHSLVTLSPQILHIIGALILAVSIGLVLLYVYVRNLIARDQFLLPRSENGGST